MPVPESDIVCRFIESDDWSFCEDRPKARAFRGPDLSLWHKGRLSERGVSLSELQIRHLTGSGQVHYTVEDYLKAAKEVEDVTGQRFSIRVEWRPDNVTAPWQEWRYAHVQVEAVEHSGVFPPEFRDLLRIRVARHARHQVAPIES
jgi:hypothetical protein